MSIEERRDERSYSNDDYILQRGNEDEWPLWWALRDAALTARQRVVEEDFEGAMASLATLRQPVDEFFAKVTVNTDDPALRENRLRLLSRIRAVMNQVADFSQIEGDG